MPAAYGHAKGGGRSMKPMRDVPKFQQHQSMKTHTAMNKINDAYKKEEATFVARKQEAQRGYFDFDVVPLGSVAPVRLSRYRQRAHLVVNTATRCGFTPQLADFQALRAKYPGLIVLAFPCNQFGNQQPGKNATDVRMEYERLGVDDLPLFEKCDVNGADAHPLFAFLKAATRGQPVPNRGLPADDVQWNFTKWLVVDGKPIRRYSFDATPKSILADIVYNKLADVDVGPSALPVPVPEEPPRAPAAPPNPKPKPTPPKEPEGDAASAATVVMHHEQMTVRLALPAKLRRDGTVEKLRKLFAKAWNKSRDPISKDAVAFRRAGDRDALDPHAPLATAVADGDVLEAILT